MGGIGEGGTTTVHGHQQTNEACLIMSDAIQCLRSHFYFVTNNHFVDWLIGGARYSQIRKCRDTEEFSEYRWVSTSRIPGCVRLFRRTLALPRTIVFFLCAIKMISLHLAVSCFTESILVCISII